MITRTKSAWSLLGRVVFASIFLFAGVGHFASPGVFEKIVPPYLPWHRGLVWISGGFEIALGALLLVPRTSRLAGWGLIALLIAVFPANVYLYQHQEILPGPAWAHLLRLPMQAVLIAWAYAYTRPPRREAAA